MNNVFNAIQALISLNYTRLEKRGYDVLELVCYQMTHKLGVDFGPRSEWVVNVSGHLPHLPHLLGRLGSHGPRRDQADDHSDHSAHQNGRDVTRQHAELMACMQGRVILKLYLRKCVMCCDIISYDIIYDMILYDMICYHMI